MYIFLIEALKLSMFLAFFFQSKFVDSGKVCVPWRLAKLC